MNIKYVTTLAIAALLAAPAAHAAQQIDQALNTGASPAVEVSNVAGKVNVTGWDRQEVKVTGTLENDEDEFEMSGDDKHVVIKVRPESGRQQNGKGARLEISVPKAASLDIQTVSADMNVKDVRGTQRLESVSGNVETMVFDEQLDLRSISGDAIINGSVGRGAVFAESTSGDVTARGLAGEFEAESVSGDLNIELRTAPRTRLNTISGDIDAVLLLVGDARLDVESISGDVDLRFTEPVNAAFDVESHSGKIDNCFGPKPERKSKYAPGTELRFTEGTGTGRVRIDTLSGEIGFCTR